MMRNKVHASGPGPGGTETPPAPGPVTPPAGTAAAAGRSIPAGVPAAPAPAAPASVAPASRPPAPGSAAPGPPKPGTPKPGTSAAESPAPEWAVQALDKVDDLVAKVRANTTERLVRIARIVVFGLLAAIMGATAGVLAVIGLIRGLDELIPGPVWEIYLLLGAIFTAAGAFLWAKKAPRPANT